MTRNVAVAIFYDQNLNLLIQERGNHSRLGEKYGFFGGLIQEGETPDQAIKRELKEEIGLIPQNLKFWLRDSYLVEEPGEYHDWLINCDVFLSPITPELEKCQVAEGKGVIKMSLKKVIKGEGFPKNATKFLKGLKTKLKRG